MEMISSYPVRLDSAAYEREIDEMTRVIEEIWHSAPLLAYVDEKEPQYVVEEESHQAEERDWPLDPAILHGLVHP